MRYRQTTMLVASAAAVAAIMVGAAGAAAEPARTTEATAAVVLASCHGESCRGKDPVEQGCTGEDDMVRVAGFGIVSEDPDATPADVNLMYSPKCDAAWGHYWSDNANEGRTVRVEWLPPYGDLPPLDHTVGRKTFGPIEYDLPMVPWGNSIKICAEPYYPSGGNCSGWR